MRLFESARVISAVRRRAAARGQHAGHRPCTAERGEPSAVLRPTMSRARLFRPKGTIEILLARLGSAGVEFRPDVCRHSIPAVLPAHLRDALSVSSASCDPTGPGFGIETRRVAVAEIDLEALLEVSRPYRRTSRPALPSRGAGFRHRRRDGPARRRGRGSTSFRGRSARHPALNSSTSTAGRR